MGWLLIISHFNVNCLNQVKYIQTLGEKITHWMSWKFWCNCDEFRVLEISWNVSNPLLHLSPLWLLKKINIVRKISLPGEEISTSQDKWTKLAICGNNPSWEVTCKCLVVGSKEFPVLRGSRKAGLACNNYKAENSSCILPCLGWCHGASATGFKIRIRE